LDNLKLYAVDMPENRSIYAERLPVTGGGYVEPEKVLHTVGKSLSKPLSVKHLETGLDVTARLSETGNDYVVLSKDRNSDFGWQTLEIDLGDLSDAAMIKLVIDGATAFPNTHEGHEIANKSLAKSKIEVLDNNNNWVVVPLRARSIVLRDGGGPTVINISNIFKTNVYKLRLKYLYKTYIKNILYDTTADEPVTISEVPLHSAELVYHGHDNYTSVNKGEVIKFIYGTKSDKNPTYLPGNYTRFGDVTPLLQRQDDKFVIFGSGDEIVLRFNQATKAPKGTSRRFLLYSNGYYKSLSNRNVSPTVEPKPFAGMSNFPYDEKVEGYPNGLDYLNYMEKYNTRKESGRRKENKDNLIVEDKTIVPSNTETLKNIVKSSPEVAKPKISEQKIIEKAKPSLQEMTVKVLPEGNADVGTSESKSSIWVAINGYALKLLALVAAIWGWLVQTLTW